jgi:hypothetical protein
VSRREIRPGFAGNRQGEEMRKLLSAQSTGTVSVDARIIVHYR